jgi:DNA-binding response OmpR family regulator
MRPGTRVLVIEDDDYTARLLKLQLEHRNLKVRCEYDGPSGLKAVVQFDPEVIVLDIMLPGLDGVGVLKELRLKGNRVPVIMLTARDTPLDKVHSPTQVPTTTLPSLSAWRSSWPGSGLCYDELRATRC